MKFPSIYTFLFTDNSGHWSHGGIFRALDKRSNNQIKDAYELAGQMDDLNLGDCLIVPIENPDNSSSSSSTKKEIKVRRLSAYSFYFCHTLQIVQKL